MVESTISFKGQGVEKTAKDTFDVMIPAEVNFICMDGILYNQWMEFHKIWKHGCP